MKPFWSRLFAALAGTISLLGGVIWSHPAAAEALPTVGSTLIARWQGDQKAAFLLMFDDGWPSHWQVAVPELARRGLTATFYVNPGKGEYQKFAREWEDRVWRQGMVYGNHTMTHKGATNQAHAEWEIGECNRAILRMVPGPQPRLISYGQPGVAREAWKISEETLNALLKQHHLISRPTFVNHGAVYHLKTAAEMLTLADRAIAQRGLEYLIIHGVERLQPNWGYQDFWALKQAILFALLDGLKQRHDQGDLWITDHISAHQYETERDTATVRVLAASAQGIRLELACTSDPQLYRLPLTLITRTAPGWKQTRIIQGSQTNCLKVTDDMIRFEAVPGPLPILLEPVPEVIQP
jgi:peptidoglycan/xylan/chitin deacetylase (PgdA/CDA1 family)